MTFATLSRRLAQTNHPPCDNFRCPARPDCARGLCCSAFVHYTRTGRRMVPHLCITVNQSRGYQIILTETIAPTIELFEALRNE